MLEELTDVPVLDKAYRSLEEIFGDFLLGATFEKKELSVRIKKDGLLSILRYLKSALGFNALSDIIGLDNLRSGAEGAKRFSLLYQLYAFPGFVRIRLVLDVDENEPVPSAVPVFQSANWAEREIYDMFGIRFAGHPDLRRIYMPEEYEGHPLRKDFPLEGPSDGL
jgi:NADH-quinone oxidoreductase subunit C